MTLAAQGMALCGVALKDERGEHHALPMVDFAEPRHTAFLPYELLVPGDRAVMLQGKQRIARSFPDLSRAPS